MTMRLPKDERKYRAKIGTGNLLEERAIHDFNHWKIIKNRYPHTRISVVNHLLVLKRKCSGLDQLKVMEAAELFKIIEFISNDYDNVAYNLNSMSSVKDIPHLHLYKFKELYK